MKLEGSIVNFLGDSITEGCGVSVPENYFTAVIARDYGLKAANNYGIGGTRIARQHVKANEIYDRDFCERMDEMDPAADAVVVFGGTNDYGHGDAPLGVMSDRTPMTFYGACHTLMTGLMSRFPGKPILFVTPLRRKNDADPYGDGCKPYAVAPLERYRDIILETAFYHALPVLDLYADCGIDPENDIILEKLMPDGLHPNDLGHAILARRIAEKLRSL